MVFDWLLIPSLSLSSLPLDENGGWKRFGEKAGEREEVLLTTRRFRFIFHSGDTGILSNSSTAIHYHYLDLSLDVVFASSTKRRQFPLAVINIYILREWIIFYSH